MKYIMFGTHLPTGHCKECDTIKPDIRAEFDTEDIYTDFDHIYTSSVLLVIKMFPELFAEYNKKVSFGLHYERSKTAGIEKLRVIVVMWMLENNNVEYYIDKITKNSVLTYDQRIDILNRHQVPPDMREQVDLMKRSTRFIIYPPETTDQVE